MSLTLRGRKDDDDVVNEAYRGHVDDESDDVSSSGHDGGGHVADGGGKETGCRGLDAGDQGHTEVSDSVVFTND